MTDVQAFFDPVGSPQQPEGFSHPFGEMIRAFGLHAASVTPLEGGADSAVVRVEGVDGKAYALRVNHRLRHRQFVFEASLMQAMRANGIPVPQVHGVKQFEQSSAMLLDYAPGQTVFEGLATATADAGQLGMACGRVLAAIHRVPPLHEFHASDWQWLPQSTDEARMNPMERELLDAIQRRRDFKEVVCHFDYHPLNLFAEGEHVTAVIDWSNASLADPRMDVARTVSILSLEPLRRESPAANPTAALVVQAYHRGFVQGYQDAAGPLKDMSVFLAWAGAAYLRDLGDRAEQSHRDRTEEWIEDALNQRVELIE